MKTTALSRWLGLAAMILGFSPRVAAADELEGKWATEIFAANLQHARWEHEFSAGRATMTMHLQNAIPLQMLGSKTVRRGTYRIVGPSAATPGAIEVDIKVESIMVTLFDPDSVWLADRDNSDVCSLRGWTIGVARDVTGKWCAGDQMAEAGDVEKIIVKRDGDTLRVSPYWGGGAVEPGPAASANRAATLDDAHPLRRAPEEGP